MSAIFVNTKFEPFSYDELIKPVKAAVDEHRLVEEKLNVLSLQAGEWEKLAENEVDRDAYDRYKSFAEDLYQEIDDLAKNGIDYNSRKKLYDFSRRYQTDIHPIGEAWKTREEFIKAQEKTRIESGDQTVFTNSPRNIPLTEIIKGNYSGYGQNNLIDVADKLAEAAKAASARQWMVTDRHSGNILGGNYYTLTTTNGYADFEDILNAANIDGTNLLSQEGIKNVEEYSPEIAAFLNNYKNMIKYDEYSDEDKVRLSNAAYMGLNKGLDYRLSVNPLSVPRPVISSDGRSTNTNTRSPAYFYRDVVSGQEGIYTASKIDKDIETLKTFIANPSIIDAKYPSGVTGYYGSFPSPAFGYGRPNRDKLRRISEEYPDIEFNYDSNNNTFKIMKEGVEITADQLKDMYMKRALLGRTYFMNTMNASRLTNMIRTKLMSSDVNTTGLYKIKNGRVDSLINDDEWENYLDANNTTYEYSAANNYIVALTRKNNKTYRCKVSPDLIDTNYTTVSIKSCIDKIDQIKSIPNYKDDLEAMSDIHTLTNLLMTTLVDINNSGRQVQGTTSTSNI